MNKVILGEILEITSSKRIHAEDYVEYGIPFYRSKEVIQLGKGERITEVLHISHEQYSKIKSKFPVPVIGDILLTSVGTIGIPYYVTNANFYFKDGNLTWFRNFSESINSKYLLFWMQSSFFKNQINNNNIGAVQKALTIDFLKKFEIKLPPLDTQKKIASFLSTLDSKIELNNRINAELEAMAKTLYDYWFVQFDFPDKNGKPYKTSGGKMVWNGELKREIPEGWNNGKLLDIGDIIGGSTPPKEIKEYFSNVGTAWITPKDLSLNVGNKFITKGEINVSEKGLKAASLKVMPKGTILLSSRAPIGYMAISRDIVTTNQGFKSFISKSGYSTPFIFYTIKNSLPEIVNNASGSTFKEISGGTLKTIKICLPEKMIIRHYTDMVTSIFERQNLLEIENQQLAKLRDWLLPMLMNGQVTVIS